MSADLLDWLLRSSLALGLATALVLLLRPLWRRWLGAPAVLWLYLLLPAALLATSLPGPVRVVEVPAGPRAATAASSPAPTPSWPAVAVPADPVAHEMEAPGTASARSFPERDLRPLGLLAWAAGALGLGIHLLRQQRRFRRRLGSLRPQAPGVWQAATDDIGPVVIGLLRPRIVVPADFEHRYDPEQQRLVLDHERVHLRRGDLPVNALACALRCVFWFHPLVHLAASKLRLDQELACDAAVLARHPRAGRAYATALLNTQLADLGLPVGCAWQSSHPLTWRITMLKKPLPGSARLMLGAGLAVLASSAAATALWQQQPATLVALPAIATPVAGEAPLPALDVDDRVPLPAPRAAALTDRVVATAAPAAAPMPATPVATLAPAAAPMPDTPVATPAPVAAPASPGASHAPAAPAPSGRPYGEAPRAALADPVPFAQTANVPLPLPPVPRGEFPQPDPKLSVVSEAASENGRDFVAPTVRRAQAARVPLQADLGPDLAVSGGMVVRVDIDARGKPVDVQVHENQLGDAWARNALAAVKRWRFTPARENGKAVPATVLVPVWFEPERQDRSIAAQALSHPKPTYMPPPQRIAGQ